MQFVPWSESCAAVAGEKCVMMQWTAIELQQNEFRNLITEENRPHSPHDKIHPVPNHNKNISVTYVDTASIRCHTLYSDSAYHHKMAYNMSYRLQWGISRGWQQMLRNVQTMAANSICPMFIGLIKTPCNMFHERSTRFALWCGYRFMLLMSKMSSKV